MFETRTAVLLLLAALCLGAVQADPLLDAPPAKQFCASPQFKQLQCGFASQAEQAATLKNQCPLCGTLFRSFPDTLPATVSGVDRYNQWGVKTISLACKGPVVVRSVFKILDEPAIEKREGWEGTDCTNAAMLHVDESLDKGRNPSPVVRCELELSSTGGSETERALKGKEGKCWVCGACNDGKGCPSAKGVWYSDSYTTVARGCDLNASKGHVMHRAGININPRTKVLLAKFEVCNSPGCFDAAYEQQKLKSAKQCIKGKCA